MPQQQPLKLHSLKEAMNGAKAPSPVKKNIKWTEEEWGLIVKEFRSQRLRKGVGVEQAVRQCQHVLPTSRHRPINAPACADINKRAIKAAEEEKAAEAKAKAAEAAEAVVAAEAKAVAAVAAEAAPTSASPAASSKIPLGSDDVPRSPGEVIAHELTIAFASVIANALSSSVVKEAIKGVMRDIMGVPAAPPDPMESKWPDLTVADAEAVKLRVPRILIGGIVGPNTHVLRERFGKKYDLRFWSIDKSPDELEEMAAGADLCIGFTKYVSQGHEQLMKNKAKAYLRCIGGLGVLSDLIETLPTRHAGMA